MEKLNSDEKMSILMNLEGKEINKVCQTSKTMQKICNDERYNPLWKNKIREEFNIVYKGSKANDEFKFLYRLNNTKLHTVKIGVEHNWGEECTVKNFYTKEAAFNFMIEEALNDALINREYREAQSRFLNIHGDLEQFLQINGYKNLEDYLGPDEDFLRNSISEEIITKFSNINEKSEEIQRYMTSNFYLEYETSIINF